MGWRNLHTRQIKLFYTFPFIFKYCITFCLAQTGFRIWDLKQKDLVNWNNWFILVSKPGFPHSGSKLILRTLNWETECLVYFNKPTICPMIILVSGWIINTMYQYQSSNDLFLFLRWTLSVPVLSLIYSFSRMTSEYEWLKNK